MVDRYTKITLTIIAAALVCLVAQNAFSPLNAQSGIQKVQICEGATVQSIICATLSEVPVNPSRPGAHQYGLAVKSN